MKSINPLAWAHFQLRGGIWRHAVLLLIEFAALGALLVLSIASASSHGHPLKSWTTGLIYMQEAILFVYGPFAISGAIRGDRSSGMIESHRLMPLSPFRAIAGYFAGAGSQALMLAGGAALVGLFTAIGGGVPISQWIVAQAALLALAFLFWSVAAALLSGKHGGIAITVVAFVLFFGQNAIMELAPPLAMLLAPSFMWFSWGQISASHAMLPLAMALQVFLGALCFIGAMRRYARDDRTLFGVWPAVGLLAGWVALSILGLYYQNDPGFSFWHSDTTNPVKGIACAVGLLIFGVLPVANAARLAERSRQAEGPSANERRLPSLALASGVILAAILAWRLDELFQPPTRAIAQTVVVVMAWLIAMRYLLGWCYQKVERGMAIGFIWQMVTWFVPLFVDMMAFYTLHPDDIYRSGTVFAISPLGALIQIWSTSKGDTPPSLMMGLAAQVALILIPLLLYTAGKRKKTPANAVPPGATPLGAG